MKRPDGRGQLAGADTEAGSASTRLSRRGFLKAGAAVLAAGAVGVRGGEDGEAGPLDSSLPEHVTPGEPLAPATPVVEQYPGAFHPEVPFAPSTIPAADLLRFFTPGEARTVEAVAARLIPGDEGDPGAREAGVVTFIDFALARGDGFNEPIYRFPPFAHGFEGDEPPEDDGYGVVWVEEEELERYGFQSALTAREIFRVGIAVLNSEARGIYGGDFAELAEEQQDELLMALEDGEVEGFADPSAEEFFDIVYEFTLQGFLSDPQYGGNRDMVGWRLIDYPGAQRAYTAGDMTREGHAFEVQRMAELDHVHPGQFANPHVLMPVFGSDVQHPHLQSKPGVGWPHRPFEQPKEGE